MARCGRPGRLLRATLSILFDGLLQTGYVSVFDLSERELPMTDSVADGQATAPAAADPVLRFKAHNGEYSCSSP
jgi:hypothetical protein